MNEEDRLAWIVSGLESAGLHCLVMGGHAVRYYGLQRYTNDFDLVLAPAGWEDLTRNLAATGLFGGAIPVEGNSWRPGAFKRYLLGRLADGREEWLEFWKENHLLDSFPALSARRELGVYGKREIPFLSLSDLLRSKETERARDWDDVSYLEEFLDARRHTQCLAGTVELSATLAELRSLRGFEAHRSAGHFGDRAAVDAALRCAKQPISLAFLLPYASADAIPPPLIAIEQVIERKLRSVTPASPLHRSLVEVVRRQYKSACQARDREDKERIRAAKQP